MSAALRIGLIGDRDPAILAHRAIPRALQLAAVRVGRPVNEAWLATDALPDDAALRAFDALWCVPGSPYRDMAAALRAIGLARRERRVFLGTCGGFQHAVLEYARAVLGWSDAEHVETTPSAQRAVIVPLSCALVEARGTVHFRGGSRLAAAYGVAQAEEGYHCSYGLDESLRSALTAGPLRIVAHDEAGEIRAVELDDHPFFVATLFQPERMALSDVAPPLIVALLEAAATQAVR